MRANGPRRDDHHDRERRRGLRRVQAADRQRAAREHREDRDAEAREGAGGRNPYPQVHVRDCNVPAKSSRIERRCSDDARAFWVASPGRGEIRPETLPPPSPDDVVVRALYSGISRGTEALVFSGRVPPSEYERMRAPFQSGSFPAPVKYGYASVGVVERGPGDLPGRHVFSLYPHQTRYVVPASAVHPIPAAVPPQRAVLAANLETAINGVWDASPRIGDRVVVVGAGTVGSLVAWLAGRIHGCDVELVDVNPKRAAVAQRARRPLLGARGGRRRRGCRDSRERIGGRPRPRAAHRRLRGDDRRAELVRRPGGLGAARPGVSRAPADDQVVAGRQRRRRRSARAGTSGAGWRSRWRRSPTRRSTCSSPASPRSNPCRR